MLPSRRSAHIANGYTINRGIIAETGVIPTGLQLIQDTFPFSVIERKNAMVEDVNGREVPVMRVTGLIQMGDQENANHRY